jgi:hypothetical protein
MAAASMDKVGIDTVSNQELPIVKGWLKQKALSQREIDSGILLSHQRWTKAGYLMKACTIVIGEVKPTNLNDRARKAILRTLGDAPVKTTVSRKLQEHTLMQSKAHVPAVIGFVDLVNTIVAKRGRLRFPIGDVCSLGVLFEEFRGPSLAQVLN